MAKKSKEVKFTQEELNSIEQLKNNYSSITNALGNLEISRIQTEKRLDMLYNEKLSLETQYEQIIQTENNLINTLTEKYGQGNLDINTGVFTPAK